MSQIVATVLKTLTILTKNCMTLFIVGLGGTPIVHLYRAEYVLLTEILECSDDKTKVIGELWKPTYSYRKYFQIFHQSSNMSGKYEIKIRRQNKVPSCQIYQFGNKQMKTLFHK